MTYDIIIDIKERINKINQELNNVVVDIEIEKFYRGGKKFDFVKLRERLKYKKIAKKYPKFNMKKFEEIIKTPPLELQGDGGIIKYDPVVIEKLSIALLQMIFNGMDIYITATGPEGAGKSTHVSQLIKWIHYFLSYCGLIDTELDFKKIFFTSLTSFMEAKEIAPPFSILDLDEADELKRENYHEPIVKDYKREMRVGRKNFHIVFNTMPQAGEMDTSITLSRANFIFDIKLDNDLKTGMLKKGTVDFIIIPRGKNIYSHYNKTILSRGEVKQILSDHLSSKQNYYMELPEKIVTKRYNFNEVWGFNESEYEKHIKKQNRIHGHRRNITLTDYIGYIMYMKMPSLKDWGFDYRNNKSDKRMYHTISKFIRNQIKIRYDTDEKLRTRFEYFFKEE